MGQIFSKRLDGLRDPGGLKKVLVTPTRSASRERAPESGRGTIAGFLEEANALPPGTHPRTLPG